MAFARNVAIVAAFCFTVACLAVPVRSDHDSCFETTEELLNAFKTYMTGCVSKEIYAVNPFGVPGSTASPLVKKNAPYLLRSFQQAYIVDSQGLETFLEVNKMYKNDPVKLITGLKTLIGFPIPTDPSEYPGTLGYTTNAEVNDGNNFELVLFKVPGRFPASDPSFAFWGKFIQEQYGYEVPLDVQAEVNKVYGSIDFSQSEPFFEAYHELTGCPADGSPQPFFNNGPQQPSPGVNANVKNPEEASEVAELCNEDYFQAFNLTKLNDPHYIYAGLPCPAGFNQCTSQKCVKRYLENQCHIPITPAGFRAILDICFDANPFNTGNGFTWNSAPNPLVCKPTADQTAFQRLGVPEFVINNALPDGGTDGKGGALWGDLKEVTSYFIEFSPDTPIDLDFLRDGYC